jgi:lipopolysaccharide/colanic/teichoic acid biosynthesis glycosyltransferase
MSIVGPRPEVAYFYQKFEKYIVGFNQRLLVKPGLTGWAQVNGGYDLKPEEKIVFDLEYIKKQSVFFDMKIIIKTILVVINKEGAH